MSDLECPEGFRTIGTGGGCTAWHKDLPFYREVLITDGDANAPTVDGDLVLGIYVKEDGAIGGSEPIGQCDGTLAECLAYLENLAFIR